jgi:hypothetical protein
LIKKIEGWRESLLEADPLRAKAMPTREDLGSYQAALTSIGNEKQP